MKLQTKTKLIWSITPFGIESQTMPLAAKIISKNHIQGIKAIYSSYSKELIKSFNEQLLQAELKSVHPSHYSLSTPLLLEFIGRSAHICVPNGSLNLQENTEVTVLFSVDVAACAKSYVRNSDFEAIEVIVSAADQLTQIKEKTKLIISYGYAELEVTEIKERSATTLSLVCVVKQDGVIESGMDLHSQHISRSLFPLIAEDKESLESKFDHLGDYIILDGLQSEEELQIIKRVFLGETNKFSSRHPSVPINADVFESETILNPRFLLKIDSKASLDLFPKVISSVDGVLLSRAELGLDIFPHDLPILQKDIVAECKRNGKMIAIASELMFSMRNNPNPTRAEVSDVANAVADGCDALVLPHEITQAPHAQLVAEVSQDVLEQAEAWQQTKWNFDFFSKNPNDDDLVIYGALRIASEAKVKCIVCFTEGGYTAFKLSAMRTPTPIVALTHNKRIMKQLSLLNSVFPIALSRKLAVEKLLNHSKELLVDKFNFKKGDKFVFVSLTSSSVSIKNSNLFTLQEID